MPLFRNTLAALTATALGAAALALVPSVGAAAAELDPVTSVTIASPDPGDPGAPLTVGQMFRVDVAWSLPATAQPGDTFSVSFPSPVHGYTSSVSLKDSAGEEVGVCAVSSTAFDCTLGDYLETHTAITGTLFFYASAAAASEGTLLFESSAGTAYHVAVPGGGIGESSGSPATAPPTALTKGGWQNADGTLGWLIYLPGALLLHDGAEVAVTDTYDSRLTLLPASLSVERVADADWNGGAWPDAYTRLPEGDGPGAYSVTTAAPSFTLTVHDPDPQSTYVVSYQLAVPAGTVDGTVFDNSVRGDGIGSDQTSVSYVTAGGAASGEAARDLAVTKRVAGAGTPPAGTFPISVDCAVDGASVTGFPVAAALAAGETRVFPRIPVGAACTVRETDSRGAAAVSYSPADAVAITAGDGPVEVVVTNTYAAAPTQPGGAPGTPTPTNGGATPGTPTAPAAPAASGTPAGASAPVTTQLAHTGSDGMPGLLAGGAGTLALLAGIALTLLRRGARRPALVTGAGIDATRPAGTASGSRSSADASTRSGARG